MDKHLPQDGTKNLPPADAAPPSRRRYIAETDIEWPSYSYRQNARSTTYRLSELVFGSLLASYVLGFLNFGFTTLGGNAQLSATNFFEVGKYLFISLTFCYLTAVYYLTYHSSILTMPQIPSSYLRHDFTIAIIQAIIFGFSMFKPDLFLLFTGVSLIFVFNRQNTAAAGLADMFARLIPDPDAAKVSKAKKRARRRDVIKKLADLKKSDKHYEEVLPGWLPLSGRQWILPVLSVILGIMFDSQNSDKLRCLPYFFAPERGPNYTSWNIVLLSSYALLFLIVFWRCGTVFERSPTNAKETLDVLDDAAEQLVKSLKEQK